MPVDLTFWVSSILRMEEKSRCSFIDWLRVHFHTVSLCSIDLNEIKVQPSSSETVTWKVCFPFIVQCSTFLISDLDVFAWKNSATVGCLPMSASVTEQYHAFWLPSHFLPWVRTLKLFGGITLHSMFKNGKNERWERTSANDATTASQPGEGRPTTPQKILVSLAWNALATDKFWPEDALACQRLEIKESSKVRRLPHSNRQEVSVRQKGIPGRNHRWEWNRTKTHVSSLFAVKDTFVQKTQQSNWSSGK